MKTKWKRSIITLAAIGLAALTQGPATAKEFYKMSTLGPGSSPYVVMTTFAKIANQYVPDTEIQVNATGVATRHALDAARGKLHLFMSAASVHHFMSNGIAMYKKVKEAPELSKNIRGILNFPIGVYHIVTFADSGIASMKDIKGKKVFVGPPAGAAKVIATAMAEGMSGLKAGEDFEVVNLGWGPAAQAFQDRQFDVYINPTNAPSPVIGQITLTNKVRLIGLRDDDFKAPQIDKQMKLPGRTLETIDPAVYGDSVVNKESVHSIGSWVGIGTHKDVPGEAIYAMTKAFWEHLDEVHAVAPWLKVIRLERALEQMNMPLHKGAARYYKEVGLEIPPGLLVD